VPRQVQPRQVLQRRVLHLGRPDSLSQICTC